MKHLPYTDALVDESIRGQRYLVACVLVHARHLTPVRRATAVPAGEGKRLHFHQELASTRRTALGLFATMPVRVTIAMCLRGHGVTEFNARDACLADAVAWAFGADGRWLPLVEPKLDDVTELRP